MIYAQITSISEPVWSWLVNKAPGIAAIIILVFAVVKFFFWSNDKFAKIDIGFVALDHKVDMQTATTASEFKLVETRLTVVETDLKEVKADVKDLKEGVHQLDVRMTRVETKIENLTIDIGDFKENVNSRFTRLERLMETNQIALQKAFENMQKSIDNMQHSIHDMQ